MFQPIRRLFFYMLYDSWLEEKYRFILVIIINIAKIVIFLLLIYIVSIFAEVSKQTLVFSHFREIIFHACTILYIFCKQLLRKS
jgi:hypothetical protein